MQSSSFSRRFSRNQKLDYRRPLAMPVLFGLGMLGLLAGWFWPRVAPRLAPLGDGAPDRAFETARGRIGLIVRPPLSTAQGVRPPDAGAAMALQQPQRSAAGLTRGLSAHAGRGVTVDEAPPGSAARDLGLERGDVIISVNGKPINSPAEFAQVYATQGKPRQLEAVRDGQAVHRHP